MSSLQQAPAKGQQVPPSVLIDGVSRQQIDAAVKAHVRAKRAEKAGKPVWPTDTQKQIIDVMLKLAADQASNLGDALDQESEKGDAGANVSDTRCMAMILEREIERVRGATHSNIYELTSDICCLSVLLTATRKIYDDADTWAGRILADWDTALLGQMSLVECAEVLA